VNFRYNIYPIAGSPLGNKHSEDTIKKMSGKNHYFFGKTHTEDTRRACEPRGLGPHVKK
jgi:hypothetical protein